MRLAADQAPPKDAASHAGVSSHQACGFAEFRVAASPRRVCHATTGQGQRGVHLTRVTRDVAPAVPKSACACSAVSLREAGTKDLRRSVEAAAEYRPCYARLRRHEPDARPGAPAEYRRRLWSGEVFALLTTGARRWSTDPCYKGVRAGGAREEHNAVLGRWAGEADA